MTRKPIAILALALILTVIGLDSLRHPANPYLAPAAFALGSGQVATGGFCGALPG
ncbi:MAG: hypothetical protein Q4G24_01145 [Paracoccus sp. (in: a-proteobacteria)]|uniref:hypothetical protein n=1 Tax=Paracoccus sp. TaxID=267 RepID=UPI0026E0CAD6|nr:hypothetical protein [Paracoccus sp. (in: a-proteobacteria)]MDO5620055.1 hypothetical protein [Paracoccus sp. (in: a-proteobacteria)]